MDRYNITLDLPQITAVKSALSYALLTYDEGNPRRSIVENTIESIESQLINNWNHEGLSVEAGSSFIGYHRSFEKSANFLFDERLYRS